MIAAEPAAAGNSREWIAGGNFQRRAQRDWLPGRCGLLPSLLFGAGRTAGRRSGYGFVIARLRIGNWLRQMRHSLASADGLKRSLRRLRGDKGRVRNTRTMRSAGGWPADRIRI